MRQTEYMMDRLLKLGTIFLLVGLVTLFYFEILYYGFAVVYPYKDNFQYVLFKIIGIILILVGIFSIVYSIGHVENSNQ